MKNEVTLEDKAFIAISFLAKEEELPVEEFIDNVLKRKEEKEQSLKRIAEAKELFKTLPAKDRADLLKEFEVTYLSDSADLNEKKEVKSKGTLEGTSFKLAELTKYRPTDFAEKPIAITINGHSQPIKTWYDTALTLVKQLIVNGDLSDNDLPLVPTARASRAFINNTDTQLKGMSEQFKKIADGVYVDTKYNSAQFMKNMHNTLKKLSVIGKYDITIKQ